MTPGQESTKLGCTTVLLADSFLFRTQQKVES